MQVFISRMKIRKVFKWIGITLGSIILFVILGIGVLIWQRPWMPFMDDGPFHGKTAEQIPTTKPLQVFPIKEFVLEVYAPASDQEAPVVLLRDSNSKIKWAVYAQAYDKTQVYSLKFYDYRTIFSTTVRGTVAWTYGNEAMWWFIERDGSLKEYWYSW